MIATIRRGLSSMATETLAIRRSEAALTVFTTASHARGRLLRSPTVGSLAVEAKRRNRQVRNVSAPRDSPGSAGSSATLQPNCNRTAPDGPDLAALGVTAASPESGD